MLKHSKSGPLKVALLSISPHNRAILEFFFAGAGQSLFKVVKLVEAEALIVDYDHPGAKEEWAQLNCTDKAGIILSVHPVDLPQTVWIPKPLTSKALTEAATKIQDLIVVQPTAVPAMAEVINSRELFEKVAAPEKPLGLSQPTVTPFGINTTKPQARFNTLMQSAALEEDEEEDDLPPLPSVETIKQAVVFDPAETALEMEEIAKPLEPSVSPEVAEKRWRELCGNAEDIRQAANWHTDLASFTPDNYFLSGLLEALRRAKQANQAVQLTCLDNQQLVIFPELGQIFTSMDSRADEFALLCKMPIATNQLLIHTPVGYELTELLEQVKQKPEFCVDLEGFVWAVTLLTAQGRVQQGADLSQKIALIAWPNMTRLEQFPHIMRIAALWTHRPGSVFEIAHALAIPQRYVISFYTAANNLNLFELDQTKLKAQTTTKEPPKENRGLFARLLKRLLGGSAK